MFEKCKIRIPGQKPTVNAVSRRMTITLSEQQIQKMCTVHTTLNLNTLFMIFSKVSNIIADVKQFLFLLFPFPGYAEQVCRNNR